ncbi:MAG: non-canonical purine NTP pyrophosphatase [Kiritimatiellia bacterium]
MSSVLELPIRQVNIKEMLEVDLVVMVQAEVAKAHSEIRVPCIVEHAGLIFPDLAASPIQAASRSPWVTLGDRFIEETHSANCPARLQKAVVAYCDGMSIKTFVGETKGKISDSPRGMRSFY